MEVDTLQAVVRQRVGLRIGPEMAAYLARRLRQISGNGHGATAIPVIGADARTGIPLRMELSVASLHAMLKSAACDNA